ETGPFSVGCRRVLRGGVRTGKDRRGDQRNQEQGTKTSVLHDVAARERDASALLTAFAIALLGERRELRPLIGREASPHAKQHDRAGLVHLSAGGLDNAHVIEDRGIVARLDEAVEFLFGLIERLHPLAQHGLGFLEDFLEPSALLGGESELAPEPLVLPPLTTLGKCGGGAEGKQGQSGDGPYKDFRDFHG